MSNSNVNDIELACNQETKSKTGETKDDFSNPPHAVSPHQTTSKNKMQQTPKQLLLIVHFTGKRKDKR